MHPNVHFTYDVASGMQMSLPKYAQSQTTCPELTVSSTRESRSLVGAEEGGGRRTTLGQAELPGRGGPGRWISQNRLCLQKECGK